MTSIDMDGLVPNPFPTIEAGDDVRALMAQLNQVLTTAETALYKADTLVAVLNDTDDHRGQWLPWNQGRNLRMRVQQAIDAVVTAQAMHAPYPKSVREPAPVEVWYYTDDDDASSPEAYLNAESAKAAAIADLEALDPGMVTGDEQYTWRAVETLPGRYLLDDGGRFTGWSVSRVPVAAPGAKPVAR